MSVSGKILKDIIRACVLGVIILCLAVSMGVSGAVRDRTTCTGTEITVLDSAECGFVSEQDVLEYLSEGYGQTAGVPVGNLDLKKMETMLYSRSAILKSEAYCTRDGILHIDITQRKPFMRFQKDGAGFYADEEGYIFPVRPGRSGYVVVIDGHIPLRLDSSRQGKPVSEKERAWLGQMTELVGYMSEHKGWDRNIVQINVRENGDLILIPREGREKFIFGKPERTEEKFGMMECYYGTILPVAGKDRYSSVDVRYEGQIICK